MADGESGPCWMCGHELAGTIVESIIVGPNQMDFVHSRCAWECPECKAVQK